MKRTSTFFLKSVLLLIAAPVLFALLYFPQIEGRNANADMFSIYFRDPFLAYIYVSFIPFFVGLYQAFKLLNLIELNKAFSQASVKTLRNMKYCSLALAGFLVAALSYIMTLAREEDGAGAIVIAAVVIFASMVIATAAAVFEQLFQNALDLQSDNDLTV